MFVFLYNVFLLLRNLQQPGKLYIWVVEMGKRKRNNGPAFFKGKRRKGTSKTILDLSKDIIGRILQYVSLTVENVYARADHL